MELYRIVVALFYKDVAPHGAGICYGIVLQRCRPSRGWDLLWHCSTKMSPLTGLGFVVALFYKDVAPHGAGICCGIVLQRCRPSRADVEGGFALSSDF